jgi:hypothetical protein
VRHHDGAVPVDGDKGPGQRRGDNGPVDEAGVGVVAEVKEGQVEEVDDENDLGPGEVGADEEHHEGEVQEVVEDEVTSDAGGSLNIFGVLAEEVADVADLEDPKDDFARVSRGGCQREVGNGLLK